MATTDQEIHGARVATISALIVIAGFVASKAARDAILLSSFDVRYLPLFIGLSAVISFPVIVVTGKLMTRFGPARLMPALNAISAALAVAEWLLLARYPRPATVAIFLHLSTSGAVLVSGFWSIVNERFDVQSAKRHIGRIGMGATVGGILGGVIAERTAVYLSPDKILLVLAAMQAISAAALYAFGRGSSRAAVDTEPEGTWFALGVVARSRLLRNVGAIVVLGAIAGGILDYVFKADIVGGASKQDLLRSLSIFYTITAVVTAVIQIAVCTPLVARLGVPRSVATLPITVTAFGALAVAIPGAMSAVIARGAELVTRNSVYRAGYELLYAPMSEAHKRPTKVVLDVGGDRIGDLLGAQLVGALVFALAAPRTGLLIAAVVIGAISVLVAIRLPRSYTQALEESLLARAPEPAIAPVDAPAPPEPWATLSLPVVAAPAVAPPRSTRVDPVAAAVAELRSDDPARIKAVLAQPLTPELATHVVALVGRDDVAREALVALHAVAPGCTGMLVDALLDRTRDVAIRRRLPAVLLAGEPVLAAWGLWRGLGDPSFDVRYRCGAVLSRLAADGHLAPVSSDDVFETVKREFLIEPSVWKSAQVTEDLAYAADEGDDGPAQRPGTGLQHVFTMLGLVLPAEPLRIALRAVQTDDPALRGTALEYLESILPADVRAQLWPLLAGEGGADDAVAEAAIAIVAVAPPPRTPRTRDELLAELHHLYAAATPARRPPTAPA